MGWLDCLRRGRELPVVFTGEYMEAELVRGILEEEGFHPYELTDVPRPYFGSVGLSRVLVPPEELEGARGLLLRLRERAAGAEVGGTPRGGGEDDPGDGFGHEGH